MGQKKGNHKYCWWHVLGLYGCSISIVIVFAPGCPPPPTTPIAPECWSSQGGIEFCNSNIIYIYPYAFRLFIFLDLLFKKKKHINSENWIFYSSITLVEWQMRFQVFCADTPPPRSDSTHYIFSHFLLDKNYKLKYVLIGLSLYQGNIGKWNQNETWFLILFYYK